MPSTPPAVADAAAPLAAAASRRPLRTLLRFASGLLLSAASLLLIAWLTLHWGILPRIEQWRPQIEARASEALGIPVRIGSIEVRSGSWVPAVELRDVRLLDAQQRPALTLPRVAAALSPRSLLSFELRFAQLLIEGAQLDVRRDAAGRLFVAGFDLNAAGRGGDDGALRDWLFEQHELVVRGGSVRWIDEQRDARPLALTDVQFALRNGLLQHDLRLDATPDAAWGRRFSLRGRFRQPLLARAGDWQRWSGNAFADLPHVDVRELRRHVTLPFELDEGEGALRAWIEIADGRPRQATADVALRSVAMRLSQQVEALAFEQLEGRVVASRDDAGTRVALQHFGFVTGDGLRWPTSEIALGWRQREGRPADGGEFRADRLDLELMAQIAGRVPLGEALRRLLAELKPQGVVSGLVASWEGALDAPTRYQAKAGFTGLTLAAKAASEPAGVGRPGLRNAALQIEASEAGGKATLGLDKGALELPGVLEEPLIALDTLSAQLAWKIETPRGATQPRISVQVKDGRFANADMQGELVAAWSTGGGEGSGRGGRYPGQLELDGRIARGDATQVARYLPLGIPEAPRRYVERAVKAGTVRDATFRVKGDLWDFPFYAAKTPRDGEFRIAGKVEDAHFAYVPSEPAEGARPAWITPWPAFTKLNGELVIDRASLEIRGARAQLGNVALSQVQGGIRHLSERSVFTIDGVARGPLAEMLGFVNTTPVADWSGHALARAAGSGNAELKLALALPLHDLDASTVKGSVVLAGNDLRLRPEAPLLAGTRGRVDFSQKGFAVVGASAKLLGGELAFEGGTQPDGSLRFNGQGTASAEGLRRAGELGVLARLGTSLSGQAGYRASLGFVRGLPEFSVTSSLVGLGIELPAPLRKPAEASWPLRIQSTLAADARDTLRVELGNIVQAQFVRDLSGDAPKVLRGGIGVFEPAPTPAAGVHANVNLASLRIDPWEPVLDRLFPATPAAAPADASEGYAPSHIALRVQELHSAERHINRLVAGLSLEDGTWRGNLDAEQLNGYVEYRPARAGSGQVAGRIHARLARLALPKSEADGVENLLDQQQPRAVPALDIVVDDLELRGKRLGRVEIEAVNGVSGEGRDAVREWRLNKFNITTPEAQLTGRGQWAEVGGTFMTVPGAAATARRRAVMDFKLEVANGGALLERFGMGKVVRGSKGVLTGQLSWLGSPLALDYGSMKGKVNVAIDSGQFLKAEPGAARLLSVLSLQSLPRRLALDFRDVFQEGFAFDNITGDVLVEQGVAQTNNLRMRGVQAVVLMEGRADIARETQDLRVIVVPEINAGTASLAYAAINPALGLGTFLAQVFLRKPLIQAGTREFHVSGPWADPKVEKVERKFSDAVPEIDAAASAPRPAQ